MRLKGLKLQGFKSFADKTEFQFSDGITCIVGPNGCGKSNVVDAVKWVLGEQRVSALRGDEMTDVIFGGTTNRKPLGFAEVALVFDNDDRKIAVDFAEVEVARRLFRDGTSEYLLNRSPCRLRDLRELLMDTGSGPGALTFMEQGRIDQILKESMQDRRVVFEEAAGISKYKARRKESLRRLEKVEADLLRVSDVVAEKERLVRSLKIQAGRAERYQALVDEMRKKRLVLAMHRYGSLLSEREAATSRVSELTVQEEAARAQVKDALGQCRQVEEELETRRKAVSRTEQEIASLDGQQEAAREKAAFAARLASELDGKIRWYAGEIENAAGRLKDLASVQEEAAKSLERAVVERDERRDALAVAERDVERARHAASEERAAAQRLSERAYAVLSRRSQLSSRRGKLEAEAQSLTTQSERLTNRLDAIAVEASAFGERLAAAEAEASAAAERMRDGAERLAAAESRVAALETELRAARENVSSLDREVSAAKGRVELLKSLESRREGVGEGARKLLDEAKKGAPELAGVRGILAEMIETDAADAPLVETALGALATAVVVATFDDAERAARFLDAKRLGRCTFLPLDVVEPARAPVAGGVASMVRCAAELRPVVDALLGESVAVEDLAAAKARRAAARKAGDVRLRAVTAGGSVLEPVGAVAAGGAAGGAGILQRRSELRDLTTKLAESTAKLDAARADVAAAEAKLVETRREVAAARDSVRAADAANFRAKSEVERSKADAARSESERDRIAQELAEVEKRGAKLEDEASGLDHETALLAGEESEVERARADASRRAEEADAALRAAEDARSDSRVHLASVVERCASLESRAKAVTSEIADLEANVLEAQSEMAACEKRRGEADERGREAHKALDAAQKRRDRCIEELALLRHQAAQAHTRLEEQRTLYESLETGANAAAQELHRFRLRENEARLRVEGLIDRIKEELSIDLHEAWSTQGRSEPTPPVYAEGAAEGGETAPVEFDPQAMETEISDLKGKIERMGAVNLEALAQLQTEDAEAKRLAAQHEDLTKSRAALLEAIKKIDAESREMFVTTFNAIRTQFQEMFRRMFGGGKADVFLEEGQDVLEAGIEIVARPPGKESRSIALLSGGERTMTAVALMFAIYLAKPSPFCILDEVDAALDESNVDRFSAAVTDFAKASQFIIVTHNKRTMAAGAQIVGVSMPEPGVSRKIAVRLDDVGEDGQLRKTG
jgi:chromosome segregation protein